jgi:hypothetical protein
MNIDKGPCDRMNSLSTIQEGHLSVRLDPDLVPTVRGNDRESCNVESELHRLREFTLFIVSRLRTKMQGVQIGAAYDNGTRRQQVCTRNARGIVGQSQRKVVHLHRD